MVVYIIYVLFCNRVDLSVLITRNMTYQSGTPLKYLLTKNFFHHLIRPDLKKEWSPRKLHPSVKDGSLTHWQVCHEWTRKYTRKFSWNYPFLKKTSFYAGLKVKKVVYQNGGSYSYQTKRGFRKLHSIILKKKDSNKWKKVFRSFAISSGF